MKSSISNSLPSRVAQIVTQLQDDSDQQDIAKQLSEAANSYSHPTYKTIDSSTLNKELSQFIQHLYSNGLEPSRQVDRRTALAKAINLLARSEYAQNGEAGYESAYLDVINRSVDGLDNVFQCLVDVITDREISRLADLKYSELIDSTDTQLHLEIVQALMHDYSDLFPTFKNAGNAAYWSEHYRQLLDTIRATNQITNQILAGNGFT